MLLSQNPQLLLGFGQTLLGHLQLGTLLLEHSLLLDQLLLLTQ